MYYLRYWNKNYYLIYLLIYSKSLNYKLLTNLSLWETVLLKTKKIDKMSKSTQV